jgi:hypothetical protein
MVAAGRVRFERIQNLRKKVAAAFSVEMPVLAERLRPRPIYCDAAPVKPAKPEASNLNDSVKEELDPPAPEQRVLKNLFLLPDDI